METTLMEVFSLEEGDQIIQQGNVYRITDMDNNPEGGIDIYCVDEEGFKRVIYAVGPMDKVRLVVEDDTL